MRLFKTSHNARITLRTSKAMVGLCIFLMCEKRKKGKNEQITYK